MSSYPLTPEQQQRVEALTAIGKALNEAALTVPADQLQSYLDGAIRDLRELHLFGQSREIY